MQKKEIKNLLIKLPNKVNRIIKSIDQNGLGIVFIVDSKKKLIGSISDGDIRRYYLKKKNYQKMLNGILVL